MSKTISNFLKSNIILLIILLLASFVRFYDFPNRITFGPEQAMSLLVSGDYINEKFSLLGLPSTQRTTSLGHIIYYPPLFNYSLIPLLVIFNYDPVYITGGFAVLNLATGLLLYFVTKKIFNEKIAHFTTALFLFNDYMINHSLFIWSVNYLPILNLVILFLLTRMYLKKSKNYYPFVIGLLGSFSLGVEYIYLLIGALVFFLTLFFAKNRLRSFLLFFAGGILGLLPTIIFDLTHQFYHTKTLWQYLLDTVLNPGQSKITYYHFLQFWPLLAVLGGIILYQIYKQSRIASLVLLFSIIVINLLSPRVSFFSPTGMYEDLNYPKLDEAAKLIAADNPKNFNVVMTFDFDSRAHPLRYLLKYRYGHLAQGVEEYPRSESLYVLTTRDYPVLNTSLWEISSFGANNNQALGFFDNFAVYKLTQTD